MIIIISAYVVQFLNNNYEIGKRVKEKDREREREREGERERER